MINIAVLVSGSGSNLQALIDSCNSGYIPGRIVLVISSKPGVYALERAVSENIPSVILERINFKDTEDYSAAIMTEIEQKNVDLICLAGFLVKLGSNIIKTYENEIMNVHPSLLPAFGGKAMYGLRVHEEVLKSGIDYTGCTVHFVDEEYDHGPIILQKKVPVVKGDTPQTLASRVLEQEHKIYPEAVRMFAMARINTKNIT